MEYDLSQIDLNTLEVRRLFDYNRRLLPNRYLAKVEAEVHDLESAIRRTGLSIGYPAWNLLYYVCLTALPPDLPAVNLVETGTNAGYSTIILAQVLNDRRLDCRLQTVDIDPAATATARANLTEAGLDSYVDFYTEDSLTFLERYVAGVDTVHFAFLDGNHEAEHVVKEFTLLHPRLNRRHCTVYFDNTTDEGVAEALRTIKEKFGGNLIELPNCSWAPPGNAIWQPT